MYKMEIKEIIEEEKMEIKKGEGKKIIVKRKAKIINIEKNLGKCCHRGCKRKKCDTENTEMEAKEKK